MPTYLAVIATYGLLTCALAMLWVPVRDARVAMARWAVPFVLSLLVGLWAGFLGSIALATIVAFALACHAFSSERNNRSIQRVVAAVIILLLAAGFMSHTVPGYPNYKMLSGLVLSPDAIPYTRYLNFDKALIGLFLLAYCHGLLSTRGEWAGMLKATIPRAMVVAGVVLALAFAMDYVRFDPKWTSLFYPWAWSNLFFTCLPEEALFRGFIQNQLERLFAGLQYGGVLAIAIASLVFGLEHYAGGLTYVLLATVAGMGYGWVYQKTGRIESSILVHFSVNALHFVFFTYPALKH